jgi:AraC-like DNA-binding protein
VTGTTPADFFLDKRLRIAKEELRTQLFRTMTDIALGMGFRSASNFPTTFQRKTGYNPSDYRRLHLSSKSYRRSSDANHHDRLTSCWTTCRDASHGNFLNQSNTIPSRITIQHYRNAAREYSKRRYSNVHYYSEITGAFACPNGLDGHLTET